MGKKKLKGMEGAGTKTELSVSPTGQPDLYSQIFATDSEVEESPTKQKTVDVDINRKIKSFKLPETKISPKLSKRKKGKEKQNQSFEKTTTSHPKVMEFAGKKSKKSSPLIIPTKVQNDEDSSDSDAGDYEFDDEEDDEDDDGKEEMDLDNEAGKGEGSSDSDEAQSEDSEESDDDGVPKTALRRQLKDLSYEELESLKQKMGLKEYNEAMFAVKIKNAPKNKKRRKFERTNKNRPREISSKVRVPKLRQVVKVPKKKEIKDPRFESSCGEFNEKIWNTEYSFVRDIQKKEAEEMKKKIKSVGDKYKQREMRRFIQRVTDKEKSIEVKEKEAKKRIQDKEENRKRVQEGKKPFYMKKGTKKLVDLVEKYDELKSSGKLEKYLKKKRKKNAFRDKKTLNG